MTLDLALWVLARASGLAAYASICVSILSGIALRTDAFDGVATKRALRSVHTFATWLPVPLALLHVSALVLDSTARIRPIDAVLPFATSYGQLAIGLGTISFDVFALVLVTTWLRRDIGDPLWRAVHRLSYAGFVAMFAHSIMSGTDLTSPVIDGLAWITAAALAGATARRVLGSLRWDQASVTAPSDAEETSRAYFARTPDR